MKHKQYENLSEVVQWVNRLCENVARKSKLNWDDAEIINAGVYGEFRLADHKKIARVIAFGSIGKIKLCVYPINDEIPLVQCGMGERFSFNCYTGDKNGEDYLVVYSESYCPRESHVEKMLAALKEMVPKKQGHLPPTKRKPRVKKVAK
jgi:hypothetical protein